MYIRIHPIYSQGKGHTIIYFVGTFVASLPFSSTSKVSAGLISEPTYYMYMTGIRLSTVHSLQASLQHRSLSSDSDWGSCQQISEEDACFCSRFDLPTSEVPFPDWQGGRRCSLMDREKPLMGSKGGRLFLTYSFLCFERSSKARDSDRLILPLADITGIVKV